MGVIPGPHLAHPPHPIPASAAPHASPRSACSPCWSRAPSPLLQTIEKASCQVLLSSWLSLIHSTATQQRGLQHKSSQACWVSAIPDFAYKMLQEAPALAFAPGPNSRQGCSSLPCGQAEFLSGMLSVGITCRTVPSAWNALPTHSQSPPLSLLPTGPPSPDPGRQFFHGSGWVGGWFRR